MRCKEFLELGGFSQRMFDGGKPMIYNEIFLLITLLKTKPSIK